MTLDRPEILWASPRARPLGPCLIPPVHNPIGRPVTIIVPYPAGSPSDTVARIIGERMRASLGQPVILEDVSGAAGGARGSAVLRVRRLTVIRSEFGNFSTHVVNGATYALRYDS